MSGKSQTGKSEQPTKPARDERVDEAGEESFPASDPPAFTGGGDREPSGTPHGDRHASETAAGRVEGTQPPEHKSD